MIPGSQFFPESTWRRWHVCKWTWNICRLSTCCFLSICRFYGGVAGKQRKEVADRWLQLSISQSQGLRFVLPTWQALGAWNFPKQLFGLVKSFSGTLGLGLPAKYSALESIGQRASSNLSQDFFVKVPPCGSRGGDPAPWGMDLLQRFTNGAYQPNQEDFPESAGANRGPRALRSVTCACRKPSTLALIRWSNIWTGPAKSRVHEEDWNGISLKIADPNNCDNMLLETARLLLVRDSASKPWIEIVMKKSFNNFQLGFCTRTHTHKAGQEHNFFEPQSTWRWQAWHKVKCVVLRVSSGEGKLHTEASPQKRCHGDSICLRIFWRHWCLLAMHHAGILLISRSVGSRMRSIWMVRQQGELICTSFLHKKVLDVWNILTQRQYHISSCFLEPGLWTTILWMADGRSILKKLWAFGKGNSDAPPRIPITTRITFSRDSKLSRATESPREILHPGARREKHPTGGHILKPKGPAGRCHKSLPYWAWFWKIVKNFWGLIPGVPRFVGVRMAWWCWNYVVPRCWKSQTCWRLGVTSWPTVQAMIGDVVGRNDEKAFWEWFEHIRTLKFIEEIWSRQRARGFMKACDVVGGGTEQTVEHGKLHQRSKKQIQRFVLSALYKWILLGTSKLGSLSGVKTIGIQRGATWHRLARIQNLQSETGKAWESSRTVIPRLRDSQVFHGFSMSNELGNLTMGAPRCWMDEWEK